jgi:hypothetical protein
MAEARAVRDVPALETAGTAHCRVITGRESPRSDLNGGEIRPEVAALRFAFRPPLRFALRPPAQGEHEVRQTGNGESIPDPEFLFPGAVSGSSPGKVTGNPEVHDRSVRRREVLTRTPVVGTTQ